MKSAANLICSFCLILLTCSFVSAQRRNSTLLPPTEAKALTQQCSRPSAPEFSETWQPTPEEIKAMESKLARIKRLRAKCCITGAQVESLGDFYMQYAGIVVKGQRLIYINAFASDDPPEFWKERAVIVCDGGVDWGVLYDPANGKFFDLAVNGVG